MSKNTFKGALSSLYDEQRAQAKGIKAQSLVNKARNEAKRELEEAQADQPLHLLRVDGRAERLVKNDAQFYAQQQNEGLVPWAAQPGVLIDRYDVRSLVDMYVPPDARALRHRQRSAREVELEEQLCFEAYRDLVRLKCLGLSERQGIQHAEQENVAVRAAARSAAVAALEQAKGPKPLPSQGALFGASAATPAGTGAFAAVGFSYGGAVEGGGDEEEGEEEEEDSDDEEAPATAEDVDMDRVAAGEFRLEDFSAMLRWAMREEAATAAAQTRRRRSGWGRKKARLRDKRIAGQGLDPSQFEKKRPAPQGGPIDLAWIPELKPDDLAQRFGARDSPEYEPAGGRRGRSRSPAGRPQTHYITTFGGGGSGGPVATEPSSAARQARAGAQNGGVRDALPGAADPAQEGPAMLPAAAVRLHGVRPEHARRDRYGGSVSGRDYSKAKAAPAATPTTIIKAAGGKETPQERLKRLMAAQLNKKIQKDSLAAAQKRQEEEAERRARMAHEAAAMEAERLQLLKARQKRQAQEQRSEPEDEAPPRARDRSRSRERRRSRSVSRERRQRSRSRSRDRSRDRSRERRDRRRSRSRSRSRSRDRDRDRDRRGSR